MAYLTTASGLVIPITDARQAAPEQHAADHTDERTDIRLISNELVDARGAYSDLPTRLAAIEAATSSVVDWRPDPNVWTYAASQPDVLTHIWYVDVNADITANIDASNRVWLQNNSDDQYFILHDFTLVSPSLTRLTLYGGSIAGGDGNGVLTNSPISSPKTSQLDHPPGFPRDPAQWTEIWQQPGMVSISSPTPFMWYQAGAKTLGPGVWAVSISLNVYATDLPNDGGDAYIDLWQTVSTINVGVGSYSGESDPELTNSALFRVATSTSASILPRYFSTLRSSGLFTFATATTLYLNIRSSRNNLGTLQAYYSNAGATDSRRGYLNATSAYL